MTNEELNSLQSEAYEHLWNGRFRLALTAAEKVYEYRPDDSEAAICLAWAFLENGHPNKAIEFANLAVELKGDSAKTRFFRAYLLTRMGIYEGAVADIDKTIPKEKNLLSWTYITQARALAGLRKFEDANKTLALGLLIDSGDNANWANIRKWFQKANVYFANDFSVTKNNIKELIDDAINAQKDKEYWFTLFAVQKILEDSRFKKEFPEIELIEIEAMCQMFQYKPAFKKAEALKSKFKENKKFNQLYNLVQKYVLEEEQEIESEVKQSKRKTNTDTVYDQPVTKTINTIEEHKTNAVYYPNEYVDVFSVKIFDAYKDLKLKKRHFFKQINKNIPSVGVEVIFNNPFFGKENRSVNSSVVWYLNDYEIGKNNFRLNVPGDWDSIIFAQTLNIEHDNGWQQGQAKVEIYINNFKVAEKYFGVASVMIPEDELPQANTRTDTEKKKEKPEQKTPPKIEDTRSLNELMTELDSYIGLTNIKQAVRDFISYLEFMKERKKYGLKTEEKFSANIIFLGNPGTGKTTIARLLGNIFRAMGILPNGHVIEVDRSALVGQYIGETAQKTEKIISDATGGVLFVDEAYTLIKKGGTQDFGQEAIDVLLKRMEDKKGEFAVIAAGYTEEMQSFMNSNPGLKSRFTHTFTFEDYTPDELIQILQRYLKKEEYKIESSAEDELKKEFTTLYRGRDKTFGNARLVRNIFDDAKINLGKRALTIPEKERTKDQLNTITIEDITGLSKRSAAKQIVLTINEEELEGALNELNHLVGLETIKKEINDLVKLARFFAEQGEDLRDKFSAHYLFLGNPGTGKTTVARIFSKIFSALGVLTKGHLVETDRQGLVAGYVGQTAEKTTSMIDRAIGGTLFVDEAYALIKPDGSGNDFGKEAIDILLKRMEDERGKFIVIAAGYTDEMKKFIASNPGMQSRFTKSLTFEDYSPIELMDIVHRSLKKEKKSIEKEAEELLQKHFNEIYKGRDKKFGNARIVRNLLESIKQKMLLRIADLPQTERTEEKLNTIVVHDIKEALSGTTQATDYRVKGDPLKLQEYIDQLNSLTGLTNVKEEIFKMIGGSKIAQLKKERGLHVIAPNLNCLFFGNPGVGKTTVAKIFANIMHELGLIDKASVITARRADLIGSYPEQTISKTDKIINEAKGGILYIADAHLLLQTDDTPGWNVLETLLTRMEELKSKLLVVLAGPKKEMDQFINSFPLLKNRFPNIFEFNDYTPREMLAICYEIASDHGYILDEGALQMMLEHFNDVCEKKDAAFMNALASKNILYAAITNQELRIASMVNPSNDDLKIITFEDCEPIKV
ncbi:MAG: AAA family ATPase [Bacteroidota bacterium]